ncbi:hypothetical protein KKP04_07505 [Rhodomicrobium sp. Az07]|uniref:ATP-binding protein n=1 Tax=Rhodomicrobium sp. Az07 TaxID=2839034 RepID=UPI001BE9A01B|nr:ATP-binding protein [Rhodomicrobium sp. Az07]MBT3070710.1 hypothetical protein [Rhodomicrobium sp. Az07]
MALLNECGAILSINQWACDAMALGATGEIEGQPWHRLWPEDVQAQAEQLLANARGGKRATAILFRSAGRISTTRDAPSLSWWAVTVCPISDASWTTARFLVFAHSLGGGPVSQADESSALIAEHRATLIGLSRQLSEESKRLAETRKQVTQSEKLTLLGQFVGSVVHDINNVLTVMASASRFMKKGDPTKAAAALEHVDAAIARGATLVRELLDFSRADPESSELVHLDGILFEDADLLRHLAGAGVTIDFTCEDDPWPVLTSRGRLQAAVFNLVANARDAMQDGGRLSISVANCRANERPLGLAANDYVVISIADTGKGMTPEALARAGEPFFTTKAKGKGSGLGLASAYSLAEQAGGSVRIDSAPGLGTRVSLYMPRAALCDAKPAAKSGLEADLHGDAHILLVESDGSARATLASLLRRLRYTVSEAGGPDQAAAEMMANRPDLVVWSLDPALRKSLDLLESHEGGAPPFIYTAEARATARIPSGGILLRKPLPEDLFGRAVLEKLARIPPAIVPDEALRLADRVRERVRGARVRTIYELWRTVLAEKARLPLLAEARIFEARDMADTFLVEVLGEWSSPSFRFLRVGSALSQRYGAPLEGLMLGDDAEHAFSPIARAYKRCLKGVAYFDYARVSLAEGKLTLFERLVLPVSDNNQTITHLFGIATFADLDP